MKKSQDFFLKVVNNMADMMMMKQRLLDKDLFSESGAKSGEKACVCDSLAQKENHVSHLAKAC